MFARTYDRNLLGCKSEPISVRLLLSIVISLSKISDFMILLRSNGNQALNSTNVVRDVILGINSQFYNHKKSLDKKEVGFLSMVFQRIHIQCVVIVWLCITSRNSGR